MIKPDLLGRKCIDILFHNENNKEKKEENEKFYIHILSDLQLTVACACKSVANIKISETVLLASSGVAVIRKIRKIMAVNMEKIN